MLDEKDLQAIAELLKPVNEKLEKMQEDIDVLKDDVSVLKEDSAITRNAVNNLLEWAEDASVQVKIPLFKKAQ